MCRQNDEEPSKEQAPETEKALNLKKMRHSIEGVMRQSRSKCPRRRIPQPDILRDDWEA
jgi:hypothetical protein